MHHTTMLFRSCAVRAIAATSALMSCACVHAQDPAGFTHVTPQEVRWSANASIPPGGQSAVIYGNPGKPAQYYITRVKLPADYRIQPHSHPDERVYTVVSGTFYIGFGDKFDPAQLREFPAGSVFVVPANSSHFHWMKSGEAVVQISGMGPTGLEYVDHADDPRH